MAPSLEDLIAVSAGDELPETWDALKNESELGEDGLLRRYKRIMVRVFGTELTNAEQESLDGRVVEYAAKKLALSIIGPARDYWSKQVIQRSAGERESSAYLDRSKDLKELAVELTRDVAELHLEISPLLPASGRGRAKDSPRVVQAGETVAHLTPNLDDFEPAYGPPDDTATAAT